MSIFGIGKLCNWKDQGQLRRMRHLSPRELLVLREFSDPCKARLARVAEITKACAADIKENCAGKEGGRGRVRACIQKSIANIKSDQCKEALAQAVAGKK